MISSSSSSDESENEDSRIEETINGVCVTATVDLCKPTQNRC